MKRRTLLIFGLPAVLVAALLVYGLVGRERALASSDARLERTGDRSGPGHQPAQGTHHAAARAAGNGARLVRGAHLRAGRRLRAQLERGLRSHREGGAAAGDDRRAEPGCPVCGGEGKSRVAQANYRLAVSTAARWQALAGTPAVSKQEVDVQTAGAEARKAEMEAAAQDVARYTALEAFKRVVAPFDGVVTARLTDVGSYVNAAGGDVSVRGNSTELFTVADVHEMRVFVSVPQDYASLLVPEYHGDPSSALATGKIH